MSTPDRGTEESESRVVKVPLPVALIKRMDQGGGLQGMRRVLLTHVAVGHAMQFYIDQWEELRECGLVSLSILVKQLRDFRG